MKLKQIFKIFAAAIFLAGCFESPTDAVSQAPTLGALYLSGWKVDSFNDSTRKVRISPVAEMPDSVIIDSATALGGALLYLAQDSDLIDPALGEPLSERQAVLAKDTSNFSIAVLDSNRRLVAVWLVEWKLPSADGNSSSSERSGSSSSAEAPSAAGESSSSVQGQSSSAVAESSGSESAGTSSAGESSSSAAGRSSSSEAALSAYRLSDLSASAGNAVGKIRVSGSDISIEFGYGADISQVRLLPQDSVYDLRRSMEVELLDSALELKKFRITAGVQLPGSGFDSRNSLWATTSDAMATNGSATVVLKYSFSSSANLTETGSEILLETKEVVCAWAGINGGWKMASGLYFLGTYSGTNARDIYDRGYTSGTPSTGASDLTADMKFGIPFTARPDSFELTYAYDHVANASADYPQKSLAYVILVSSDNKAVALGMISDSETVSLKTKAVALSYGADPDGILTGGFAGTSDLELGTGNEDVASIRVLFASSAYAHVVAGGAAGSSGNYRGGENSKLTLSDFRLIY